MVSRNYELGQAAKLKHDFQGFGCITSLPPCKLNYTCLLSVMAVMPQDVDVEHFTRTVL
jgi:hypothetical protein